MMKYIPAFYIFLCAALLGQPIIKNGNSIYLPNKVIIKFKPGYSSQLNINSLKGKSLSAAFNISEIKQLYPLNRLNKGEENLSRIYEVNFSSPDDPKLVAQKISKQSNVEYAEPHYVHTLDFVANDSLYQAGYQSNLSKISAQAAWDVTRGDTTVIIAIVDSGVQWDHPDLASNILKDKNGKVIGYDFGGTNGTTDDNPQEDQDPQGRSTYHGTHVAGLASAVTNNKIGIASIGYSCKIMPVKASRGDLRDDNGYPYIAFGFDAIKFAADNGAKVINCSWGSFSYSRYEQDIIDYVTTKGALVVAAGGNVQTLSPHYPASYKKVFSVGWANQDDTKYSTATYGRDIDVMSPGTFVLSTYPGFTQDKNQYRVMSGSSMSTPQAAGLAGLVISKFPNYSPLQVAEQIRITADDVYTKNPDSLKYLLGKGRINAAKAVSTTDAISVRASDVKFIDEGNKNGLLETGEPVSIEVTFTNYLNPVSNLNVQVECSDSSITLGNTSFQVTLLETLASSSNASNKFTFTINKNAAYNLSVNFLIKFSANGYSDFQWISTRVNPSYNTIEANNIALTVTSKGSLAFNDYPINLQGQGFKYMGGENLMFEGALMYGTSATSVMDAARELDFQSTDFKMLQPVKLTKDVSGNEIGVTIFNDQGAKTNPLGIETKLTSYSFAAAPHNNYVIITAELKNKSAQDINGLYAGWFFDWDMPADDPKDTVVYDLQDNYGWAHYKERSLLNTIVGAAMISSNQYGFYPINNAATTGDVKLFDANGFTEAEKWIMLSSGIVNKSIGNADISFSVSSGPHNIPVNQSVKVGFVIAAANTHEELRNAIKQSRIKYLDLPTNVETRKELPTQFELYQNYPNPFNPSTTIRYQIPVVDALSGAEVHVTLKVYDVLGREVATLVNELQPAGFYNFQLSTNNYQLSSGIYFYKLTAGNYTATRKMLLIK